MHTCIYSRCITHIQHTYTHKSIDTGIVISISYVPKGSDADND